MGPLDGKTALVTGGSRGIGRAIVQRLADDGAAVMFSFVANHAAAGEVVEDARKSGGRVVAVQADQGKKEDVERLFAEAEKQLGGLDIVVINAAAVGRGKIVDITESEYDRIMAVNAKGFFLALQLAGRKVRNSGRVIHISTMGTGRSSPTWSVYTASKAAAEQFITVAAREFGPRGITVNSVSPGATETDGLHEEQTPESVDRFIDITPLRRLGQPADIANVVAFLAGPESEWITGQNIRATGGII